MPSAYFEKKLARRGYILVAGVDEAGRGPLAGPIAAAAVILPSDYSLPGLDDSKKLSPQQRNRLFNLIHDQARCINVSLIGHRMIDRINIGQANRLVMQRAVAGLKIIPDYVLVDGKSEIPLLDIPQQAIIRGDGRCDSIAAASIIAKVTRDRIMDRYHLQYPQYGFNCHKGYATPEHLRKLMEHGPCSIHRRSFAGVV